MKRNLQKGFTLIEIIIYSALIAIIIGYALGGAYSLIQDSDRLNNRAVIDEEANFILKKIGWALSSLEQITTPASGASGQGLTISRYNFASNPVSFALNSGNLTMRTASGPAIILNNDRTEINSLVFEHFDAVPNKPDGVKTTISINGRVYAMTIYQNQ